jgi:hypothetical protein
MGAADASLQIDTLRLLLRVPRLDDLDEWAR